MKLKFIQFIALFLLCLVAGVFWGTWFSLSRSMEVFSPGEFIHIGKTIIGNLAVPMRIILPSCILFMILTLWFYPEKRSRGYYFSLMAFILILIALFITLTIEVPIDNEIKEWTVDILPDDWQSIRDRWQFFHTLRTFISLAAFGSFAGGILFLNKEE